MKVMTSNTDVILGWNKDGELVFLRSFNINIDRHLLMQTYEYATKNFPAYKMTSIDNLGLDY